MENEMEFQTTVDRFEKNELKHRYTMSYLKIGVFVLVFLNVLALGGLVYMGTQIKSVPVIIEMDQFGNVRNVKVEQDLALASELILKRELQDFVEKTFRVTPDADLKNRDTEWVASHLDPDGAVYNKIKELYNNPHTDPYTRAERETVSIQVETPIKTSPSSWLVRWKETARDRRTGSVLRVIYKRGVMGIQEGVGLDSYDQTSSNPLGVIVDQFDWAVVSDKEEE